MSRFRADLCLLLVAAIWGSAFVAQKSGMDGIGPFGFVWVRFLISLIIILPFVYKEWRVHTAISSTAIYRLIPICIVFVGGVIFQQVGLSGTSVTNAGFITGLYVVFTPLIAWMIFRHRPSGFIWPACALSIVGLWYLNGGSFSSLKLGDLWVLVCAIFFGAQVVLTGWYLSHDARPMLLVATQYSACVIVAGLACIIFEDISLNAVVVNWLPIFYAGAISGGVAYTLQAVAQQYTPPSDAAIIMSAESVFAALAGILLLSEAVTIDKILGCSLIMMAILCVEARSFFRKNLASPSAGAD